MREQYQALVADPAKIEAILLAGAAKATALSAPFMRELRNAVGLRKLAARTATAQQKPVKSSLASFKQYREADGQFYFKLLSGGGVLLLQSQGFTTGKEAASAMTALLQQGADALPELSDKLQMLPQVNPADIATALAQMAKGNKSS